MNKPNIIRTGRGRLENGKGTTLHGKVMRLGNLIPTLSGKKFEKIETGNFFNVIGHNYLTALYQTRKKQSGRSTDQLFEECLKPTQEQ